jgi:hypothetical protein
MTVPDDAEAQREAAALLPPLIERAKAAGLGDREAQRALWRAVYALPRWLFIARGEDDAPRPYVSADPEGATIQAFSDGMLLREWALAHGLPEDEAGRVIAVPTAGAADWVVSFADHGVQRIMFDGTFFAPLGNLLPIRDDIAATGAAAPDVATAPHDTASSGALVENAGVQTALRAWAESKDARTFAEVVRRAAVGELLLDISASQLADPARGFQQGDVLAVGDIVDNAGKRLLLAFTSNERAGGRHPELRTLAQPAIAVLRQAIGDYEGLVIDAGDPGQFIAYAEELRTGLGTDAEAASRLAAAIADPSPASRADLPALLASAPVYIAVDRQPATDGGEPTVSVLLVRSSDGTPMSVLGTSPSEVWAWSPGSEARGTALANVARVALEDGHGGIVVNPAGPSVVIPRGELEALAG